MKHLLIIALSGAIISTSFAQQKKANIKPKPKPKERPQCTATYDRIRTHRKGDSPAMWHEIQKTGEIKQYGTLAGLGDVEVGGKRYSTKWNYPAELIYEGMDWMILIIHSKTLDTYYYIESTDCPEGPDNKID